MNETKEYIEWKELAHLVTIRMRGFKKKTDK